MATSGKEPKPADRVKDTQKAKVAPAPKNKVAQNQAAPQFTDDEYVPYDEVRPRMDPLQPDRPTADRSGSKN